MQRQPVIQVHPPAYRLQQLFEGIMTLLIIWAALRSQHSEAK